MRIISKFHDYYDSVQGIGYDPDLIYHRVQDQNVLELDTIRSEWRKPKFIMPFDMPQLSESFFEYINLTKWRNTLPSDCTLYLIGFCGKYYLVLRHAGDPPQNFFDEDSVVEYYSQYCADNKFKYNWFELFGKLGESKIKPFHDEIEPFRCINCPVFSIELKSYYSVFFERKIITINPSLADFQFYRLFDTYTAYQEIAMFISGVLGWPENDMIKISDTDMRDAKGFDEYSFKKRPTKRR